MSKELKRNVSEVNLFLNFFFIHRTLLRAPQRVFILKKKKKKAQGNVLQLQKKKKKRKNTSIKMSIKMNSTGWNPY